MYNHNSLLKETDRVRVMDSPRSNSCVNSCGLAGVLTDRRPSRCSESHREL